MKKINLNYKLIILVIGILISILLICFFSINYRINKNNKYLLDLKKDINGYYDKNLNIKSVNLYGGYYIVNTNKEVIVIDSDYKKVYSEKLKKMADNVNNYDIIYRTNKIMYEETIVKNNKLIYNYYDAYTYKKIDSLVLE